MLEAHEIVAEDLAARRWRNVMHTLRVTSEAVHPVTRRLSEESSFIAFTTSCVWF